MQIPALTTPYQGTNQRCSLSGLQTANQCHHNWAPWRHQCCPCRPARAPVDCAGSEQRRKNDQKPADLQRYTLVEHVQNVFLFQLTKRTRMGNHSPNDLVCSCIVLTDPHREKLSFIPHIVWGWSNGVVIICPFKPLSSLFTAFPSKNPQDSGYYRTPTESSIINGHVNIPLNIAIFWWLNLLKTPICIYIYK